MKSKLALSALAATMCAVLSSAAVADTKGVSALECFAANPAQAGDLSINAAGVRNNAAAARAIFCPMIRDQEGALVEGSPTYVGPWYKIGATPTFVTCTAYHGSSVNGGFNSYTLSSGIQPAGTVAYMNIEVLATPVYWSQVQLYLVCSLGPGASIAHFWLSEQGLTD